MPFDPADRHCAMGPIRGHLLCFERPCPPIRGHVPGSLPTGYRCCAPTEPPPSFASCHTRPPSLFFHMPSRPLHTPFSSLSTSVQAVRAPFAMAVEIELPAAAHLATPPLRVAKKERADPFDLRSTSYLP
jgi:hypothetical protein